MWSILCPSFGTWSILCLAAVLPRSVAKLCERGCLFARNERFLMKRRIRGKSLLMVLVGIEEVDLVVSEILGGAAVGVRHERAVLLPLRPPVNPEGNAGGNSRKIKDAQKLLEKHDPQYQQWKEEAKRKERAVEMQEQAEVLAKVMEEQFDQTMNALSPSLIAPPPFPPSPPGVPSLPLAVEERRGQTDLLGAPQLRWIEAELLRKVSFVRNGVTRDEFIQILGEQFGDRRFVAALGEFITRHGGGAAIPRAKEARSGLVFDIEHKQ